MSREVCTWPKRKRFELDALAKQENVDVIELADDAKRCGCHFSFYNECFLQTQFGDGYYVIATGADGCQSSTLFSNVSIDPGRCGSQAHVPMVQGK
jgi:hypothetical protein